MVKGVSAGWGKCSRTVLFDNHIHSLSYWNNNIAVGFEDGDIFILDAVAGSQTATFSGHKDIVRCLVFPSDGRSLVSGSHDTTVKLWDMQTGGVVRTFFGHTDLILSISISPDFTTIASGSNDKSIYLWSTHTGKCNHVIKQEGIITHVMFSPTNPQYLLSVCNGKVQQWNISGHQVGPTYDGSDIAFSPDGTQFIICNKTSVTVLNSSSGVPVTELHMINGAYPWNCCFSPDGKLVAASCWDVIDVWDITSSSPHLIETFPDNSRTLLFSSLSSLISVAGYSHIKFWQIGSPSTNLAKPDPGFAPLISAGGKLVTLQAKDGIIITSEDYALKVWDTSTSLCKASFQIPHRGFSFECARLVNGRLIFTWCEAKAVNLWDVEKGELLWAVDAHSNVYDVEISQDGSRVFCLGSKSLQAFSAKTGKSIGRVKIKTGIPDIFPFLTMDSSGVWVHWGSEYQGWNFGISGSSPAQLLDVFPEWGYLNSTFRWDRQLYGIKNEVTGKVVFQVPGKYGYFFDVQWNEHYLVVCFQSKEVLILDFSHLL